jgi:hypothetical protein
MTRFLSIPRSPAKAAAGSGALILVALGGVLFAAGNAGGASPASAPASATSAPFNAAPLVLPKPCVITKHHQTCGAGTSKQRRAKQVKKQPAPSSTLPVPTAIPTLTGP